MSTISIIIPAYNQADYLSVCIQSVLDQTYSDFEIIVVDDGSTDHTRSIAESFSDPRVHYIYQDNKGLSGARNTGIRHATAPFLMFLDSDDSLLPEALAAQIQMMATNPESGVSVGGWALVDSQGVEIPGKVFSPPVILDLERLLKGNPFPIHSAIIRKYWLNKMDHHFDQTLRACEDWDFWLRLLQIGCTFVTFEQKLCNYRMHTQQMTSESDRMRTAAVSVLDKFFCADTLTDVSQQLQNTAYAQIYLKAACRAYREGLVEDAKSDLVKAIMHDPSLRADSDHALINFLVSWAYDPRVPDAAQYLTTVFNNLPTELQDLKTYKRPKLADVYMKQAFERFDTGDLSQAGKAARQAIYHQPGWIANRGVVSILFQSLFRQSKQPASQQFS